MDESAQLDNSSTKTGQNHGRNRQNGQLIHEKGLKPWTKQAKRTTHPRQTVKIMDETGKTANSSMNNVQNHGRNRETGQLGGNKSAAIRARAKTDGRTLFRVPAEKELLPSQIRSWIEDSPYNTGTHPRKTVKIMDETGKTGNSSTFSGIIMDELRKLINSSMKNGQKHGRVGSIGQLIHEKGLKPWTSRFNWTTHPRKRPKTIDETGKTAISSTETA